MGTVTEPSGEHSVIEWGWAGSALEGGESGDVHVVAPFAGGALVALIDGLGHGEEAAAAATAAAAILEAHAGEHVLALLERCHEGLRKTRGAVMSLAAFSTQDSLMTWAGVGNVDGVLRRAESRARWTDEAIIVRGGVLGYQLPPLRAAAIPLARGDTLIMATDGIRAGFSQDPVIERTPQEVAESILARYAKGTDDARVLIARYRGPGA